MLRDWHTPDEAPPEAIEEKGVGTATGPGRHLAAHWTPRRLADLTAVLRTAGDGLRRLPAGRLLTAWRDTVAAFRDPASAERRALEAPLAALTRLSPEGLAAGLEAVLGGVAGEHAERVVAAAEACGAGHGADRTSDPTPVLVVLSSNLPALAVQPLLPILAARRPSILKSPSAEPLFTPAFAAALARREPVLGRAVAALTWKGGRGELEEPLLATAGRVLAYGDDDALADLRRRAPAKLVPYGPKTSLAVIGDGTDPEEVAAGLARDVALFDQRGCLSLAAVYVVGDPRPLATALAAALAVLARRWPPGPITADEAAAVRHLRDAATMRGTRVTPGGDDDPPRPERESQGGGSRLHAADSLATGTVLLADEGPLQPTPGLRTVRVHPLSHPSRLPTHLAAWRGRLQGVALAGFDPDTHRRLTAALTALGVSRFAPPGHLQHPDTRWHNGGVDPLEVFL